MLLARRGALSVHIVRPAALSLAALLRSPAAEVKPGIPARDSPACSVPLAQVANGEPIRLELRGALAGVADEVHDGPPPDFDPIPSRS